MVKPKKNGKKTTRLERLLGLGKRHREYDFEDINTIQDDLDNDRISPIEEGFMMGFLNS